LSYEALFKALHAAGLRPTGDVPAWPPAYDAAPWVARILLGICGWVAGVLILASIGAFFVAFFRTGLALAVVAALCLAAAATMYWRFGRNELLLQLALAVSMAGQLSAVAALYNWFPHSTAGIALATAALQCVLVFVMRNTLHRFLSTLFAVAALAVAGGEWHAWPWLVALASTAAVAAWTTEARWRCSTQGELWLPVAYALAIAVLCLPGAMPEVLFHRPGTRHGFDWAGALAWVPAWALLLSSLTAKVRPAVRAGAGVAALGLVLLAAYAPGVTAAALILLLAFSVGNRVLVGAALIAAVTYLGFFYYQMQITLLLKSIALAAAGAGCWLAWAAVRALAAGERT
jgi:hypothetical protein